MIKETVLEKLQTIRDQEKIIDGGPLLLCPDACTGHLSEYSRDHIEMICVCSGQITCFASEVTLALREGELLFLSPDFPCRIIGSDPSDLAVSLFILPEFISHLLTAAEDKKSPLRLFVLDCLFRQNTGPGYLCFQTAQVTRIRNLAENLLLSLLFDPPGPSRIREMTMTLLCLELSEHTENIYHDKEAELIPRMLDYIDGKYADGRLMDAAGLLEYDVSILSREIRRQTGHTFTELIQKKRMSQAAALLLTTSLTVEAVSRAVGYENVSYFHRLFRSTFGMTPRQYRKRNSRPVSP